MNFPEAQELLLEATCTDAYAGNVPSLRVFLNGVELATTGIEAVTDQGNALRYYDLHAFTSLLREGVNTIGVILRNRGLPISTTWPSTSASKPFHTRQTPRS